MFTYPIQCADTVPAWVSEVPPLLACLSCGGAAGQSCTDCSEDLPEALVSDSAMQQAVDFLQAVEQGTTQPILLLRELLWDIETVCDDNGNPYPGTFPYWESIPGYVLAKTFIKQLDKSYDHACKA